jgi:hypothetical protein
MDYHHRACLLSPLELRAIHSTSIAVGLTDVAVSEIDATGIHELTKTMSP